MAIAGVLMIIGSFGPWFRGVEVYAEQGVEIVNFYVSGLSVGLGLTLVTGLLMLFIAAGEFGYHNFHENKSIFYGFSVFLCVWILILIFSGFFGGVQMGSSLSVSEMTGVGDVSMNTLFGWGIFVNLAASIIGLMSAYNPIELEFNF